ncbi:hypothetical protein HDU96_008525 [Phlyctochytrium bullatum]|nr:hypothetical protein HDU96_008525 [Phlyctochytrium bullatum]
MLIRLSSPQDLVRLDHYEGDEYRRIEVEIEVENAPVEKGGKVMNAFVYEWLGGVDALDEKDWSFEQFVKDNIHEAALRNPQEILGSSLK